MPCKPEDLNLSSVLLVWWLVLGREKPLLKLKKKSFVYLFVFFILLSFFETGSYYVKQAGLKLTDNTPASALVLGITSVHQTAHLTPEKKKSLFFETRSHCMALVVLDSPRRSGWPRSHKDA